MLYNSNEEFWMDEDGFIGLVRELCERGKKRYKRWRIDDKIINLLIDEYDLIVQRDTNPLDFWQAFEQYQSNCNGPGFWITKSFESMV